MPTTITSAGITFNDASVLTSANIGSSQILANAVGTTQIANGSVTAAKLGTTEQKRIAKAWISFDGSTTTPVISASYNVSSITRYDGSAYNTTAGGNIYKINFITPMTDVNYVVAGTSNKTTGAGSTSWVIMDYTQSPVLPVVPGISTGYVVVGLHYAGANIVTNQTINNIVIFGN